MPTKSKWIIAEPDVRTVMEEHSFPLEALAAGSIPAIVLRQAFPSAACSRLIEQLVEMELLYDPHGKVPDRLREESIPEGYYREGRSSMPALARQPTSEERIRIDVGTSLGYRGSDPEAFFEHSKQTEALFATLFADAPNPVALIHDSLRRLSRGKRVETAHEPDGRRYGPAIIRAHYGGYTYRPHFDSVRLREKRSDYAVHEFDHQFAGVIVLQNTCRDDTSAQCVLHRCLWNPEVSPFLQAGTFHEYAHKNDIERIEVCLEPGDLYFFNTRLIHEVPGVAGELPRIVVATFIGYSRERNEVFVWS